MQQLKAGYHVLINDVDIMSIMELSEYDAYHALETKFPLERSRPWALSCAVAWRGSDRPLSDL
jgi:hypothetical protein